VIHPHRRRKKERRAPLPVPEKMRLEMFIGIQNEILDGLHRFLFIRLIWKETSSFTMEDYVLYSDDHFESHPPGNKMMIALAFITSHRRGSRKRLWSRVLLQKQTNKQTKSLWWVSSGACCACDRRQTGWCLHQHGWSDVACATPQQRLRHEQAWIWTVFLSEQRWATNFVQTPAGRAANDSLHDACARLKISSP